MSASPTDRKSFAPGIHLVAVDELSFNLRSLDLSFYLQFALWGKGWEVERDRVREREGQYLSLLFTFVIEVTRLSQIVVTN